MDNFNKYTIDDLGIFGGGLAYAEPLHVGRPNIPNREVLFSRLNKILDSKWLTNNGPYVQRFEQTIQDKLGVNHCIATCNGTIALEIAIKSVGLSGEVIVPAFTFPATTHILKWLGIKPVFCDIDLGSHNINPDMVEQLIGPKTTGILAVHLWGRPCNIEKLTEISKRHGLKLLFDSAHAFSTTNRGEYIGNFGSAEAFSFHGTKFINAFEGGAITTNDAELAKNARLLRNFGFSGHDNVVSIGTNGKMSEISAAMGLGSIEAIDEIVSANKNNYEQYKKRLSGVSGLHIIHYDMSEVNNYQYIVIELDEDLFGLKRDQLLNILHAENIIARRYFYPGCHRMLPYSLDDTNKKYDLKNTDYMNQRLICLPTGTSIQSDDVDNISNIFSFSHEHAKEISKKWIELNL